LLFSSLICAAGLLHLLLIFSKYAAGLSAGLFSVIKNKNRSYALLDGIKLPVLYVNTAKPTIWQFLTPYKTGLLHTIL
jgi:hypothetical protein